MTPSAAEAQNCDRNPTHPKCQTDPGTDPGTDPEPEPETDPLAWMHPDVAIAHELVKGFGTTLITVDNFGGLTYSGSLDGTPESWTHGAWTFKQSGMIAPGATQVSLSNQSTGADALKSVSVAYGTSGLNVVNLSFGLMEYAGVDVTADSYTLGTALWDSLVDEAHAGSAVFVKAAGNTNGGTVDGTVMMRMPRPTQVFDALNVQLIGAPGALFVGALDGNGTESNRASIASYSTIAGTTPGVSEMFLVVGVRSDITGLAGTSFAAPIVSGYASLLGEKFSTATPDLIVDRLLQTATEKTIVDYDPYVHGQGEANLSLALSPEFVPN